MTQIHKKTGNKRAVQLLLGHTKMDSTVHYLGVELEDALPLQNDFERTRRHMSLFMANKKDALLAEEVRFSEERSLKLSAKGFCDANENKKASSTLEPSSDKSQQDNKSISESSTENASDDSIESTTESDFDDLNESEISNCKSSSQNCGKSEAEKFSTFREKLQHKRNDSCSIVIRRSPLPPKKSCPPPSPTSQKVTSTSRYKWKAAKAKTIKRSQCNSDVEKITANNNLYYDDEVEFRNKCT